MAPSAPTAPAIPPVLIRRHGRWYLSDAASAGDSALATLDEVLARLRDPSLPEFPTIRTTSPTAPFLAEASAEDHDLVRPAWGFSAFLTAHGAVVERWDGAQTLLGELDLSVLDAIGDGSTVAEAASRTDAEPVEVRDTVSRLASLALVSIDATAAPAPAPSSVDAPTPSATIAAPGPRETRDRLHRAAAWVGARRRRSRRDAGLDKPRGDESGSASVGPDHAPPLTSAPATPDDRIPVYSTWDDEVGPLLSLGLLLATAKRWRNGALSEHYDFRPLATVEAVLDDIRNRAGPAVLLCSDYVWSLRQNLELAGAAKRANPDVIAIHGGPSCPKYVEDARRFMSDHRDAADVLVRGEGENTLCELLDAIARRPEDPVELYGDIRGITYRDARGETVRTEDRDRIADLDALPSPYLTGEFDHLPADAWRRGMALETNRGCPYGCTFCDWGSATLSRIRKFDLDRCVAEFEWAMRRGLHAVQITDANFGIMARDVEFSRRAAALGAGHELVVMFTPAKNTTKHLTRIMDLFTEAGVSVNASLSLQTTDPTTLEILDRTNISTEHFVSLAAALRRRGHPLQGDLMLGLPGQTYRTYLDDLQFMVDHEIMIRTWPVQLLPNAPMNASGYRDEHRISVDDDKFVTSTATFTGDEYEDMVRVRAIEIIAERMGLLRHVMRFLQWDHGVSVADVLDRVGLILRDRPEDYPFLSWTFQNFDIHPLPGLGWPSFYQDVRLMVTAEWGIEPGSDLDAVLALQEFLMPAPGRSFPASVSLAHDYLAYYEDATESLYTTGERGRPVRPLRDHPPATFSVTGDPLGLCDRGFEWEGDPRNLKMQGDFFIGSLAALELESPLTRLLPLLVGHTTPRIGAEWEVPSGLLTITAEHPDDPDDPDEIEDPEDVSVPIRLTTRS